MSRLSQMVGSTVGKKIIVGVTGVMLIGFVITHLLGNLLLFVGADAFDAYSASLAALPGFLLIELGLAGIFLVHIFTTASLAMSNRQARPETNAMDAAPKKAGSGWMIISGSIVLIFLVAHLVTIRFNSALEAPGASIYQVTMEVMGNPLFGLLYLAGVILLGFHLRHGLHAFLRTLGYSDKARLPAIEAAAAGLAAIITLGFASLPIYAMLQ